MHTLTVDNTAAPWPTFVHYGQIKKELVTKTATD